MRTEEEVKRNLRNDKFDLLKGYPRSMEFWEEDKRLRELEAIQKQRRKKTIHPKQSKKEKRNGKQGRLKNIMQSGIGRRYLNADILFICKTQEQKEILETVKQFISNPFGKKSVACWSSGNGQNFNRCNYLPILGRGIFQKLSD